MKRMRETEREIAERLKALRLQRKYSQRDLQREFELLGYPISQNLIFKIEHGQRVITDIEVRAYMEVFRVSSAYILLGITEQVQTEGRFGKR